MTKSYSSKNVTECIGALPYGHLKINIDDIVEKFEVYKTDKMTQFEFIDLLVSICNDFSVINHAYERIAVLLLYEKTIRYNIDQLNLDLYSDKTNYIDKNTPNYLAKDYVTFVNDHKAFFNTIVDEMEIPEYITYFGFMTMNGAYNIKVNDINIESPLDMFMRCAIGINYKSDDQINVKLESIKQTFQYICEGKFIHATPTLFNAGTNNDQLSSCYLLGMEDSIVGIYKTLTDCAKISQKCGGIGFAISNVRSEGSKIQGSNGESSGIVPMLKVFSDTAHYVNQGGRGSKRSGAFAAFIEPWHADIKQFIELALLNGSEYKRTRDLFLGLWIPDLFMKQLEINGDWYLMCPNECPNLQDTYGSEFETLYWKYVEEGKYREKIKASDLMPFIRDTLSDSGLPYMMFKDTVNLKSNQSNIGTVKSSNLCCEITEVSDAKRHAVCNLASIAVNRFLKDGEIDYEELINVVKHITRNLNKCIDINQYPTIEAKETNNATRPIGIGIQGIANLLMDMRIPYESQEALIIERKVMEAIYYGSLSASMELAKESKPYDHFAGSNFSKGIFQFDMDYKIEHSDLMFDWTTLKANVMEHGTRNSLLTALMPTASTSQILGNNECFEPITSNIYARKTSSGVFKTVNNNLVNDLIKLNIWSEDMKDAIINNGGSIQNITDIPDNVKILYKTVWEIKQKWLMDHAIYRAPFVDQSQSMNLHFPAIEENKIKSALFYAWKHGLKTASYYIRTQAAHNVSNAITVKVGVEVEEVVCKLSDRSCVTCSA
jgi:ribonucleoside-diphosphate reductase alpha chain